MPCRPLTLSLHEYHPRHTLRVDTGSVMRKTFILLVLLALSLPLAGLAGVSAGDGTLSVEDGKGKVTLQAKGGIIGRLDRGTVTIFDLTPDDLYEPVIFGEDQPVALVGETGFKYTGNALRFRVIGGRYRIVIQGRGIDLSAVGKGFGSIKGDLGQFGVYSLDGADCRKDRTACKLLPEIEKRFLLEAAAERAEKNVVRPSGRRMTAGAQTILVVEDEVSIASFVSLYLKNAGYDVRAVTTGTAALAQVASEQPALIILDLMLPGHRRDRDLPPCAQDLRRSDPDAHRSRRRRRQDHRARGRC